MKSHCINKRSFFLGIFILIACNCLLTEDSISAQYKSIGEVPPAKWEELAKKKFYFAHQSVGYNIVDGLKQVLKTHPEIKITIVEGTALTVFEQPVFAHAKNGQNRKPLNKIDSFANTLETGVGAKADIAFLKLCYVDVTAETDITPLFAAYKKAVNRLQEEYPELTIIHFTVPLCVTEKTWKTRVKLLIGKEPWELTDNVQRNKYNELLRREYGATGNLFDVALLEATKPDGSSQSFEYKGKSYAALYPEYSSDGSHLNSAGSRMIAENFLLFLVR